MFEYNFDGMEYVAKERTMPKKVCSSDMSGKSTAGPNRSVDGIVRSILFSTWHVS